MCSMMGLILGFTLFNFLILIQCASELPVRDSYGIIATELAIRDTLNNLFSTLKLTVMQQKLKLKQYSTIHNFFASITLRDHDNLQKIEKLTEVKNIDNGTHVFITQLNEILDEDNKSDDSTDSVYVKILIEEFVERLDHLKQETELHNSTKYDLNKAILRHFRNHENEFDNKTYLKENDFDENVLGSIESWQPSGRRIFGGTRSNIKRFPFMASVQFFNKFQCGGSIIKSDLIITSGSCLQLAWNNRFFRENPSFLSVQVGSSMFEQGGENISVLEVNFHPSFNPKNLRHNLAIMRLTRTLKFARKGSKIKKINFDRNPWPLPANSDGIVIVGWGARAFGTNILNLWKNELSFSTLDFYPLMECQEIYTKEFVTDRNFCAGFFSKGGGACNHDAGGPGVLSGTLVGVISFGSPVCGTPDAPTVFTKLGYYAKWIDEIMEKEILVGSQTTTYRPVKEQAFGLPSFKKTTPFKITPIIDKARLRPNQFDTLRTEEKKHEYKDFLKTMFKKKKQAAQHQKQEDLQGQENETEEVTDSIAEVEDQDKKELEKLKSKLLLRNKPERETEKDRKLQLSAPTKKISEKTKTTESQSQSYENLFDETLQPNTAFEINIAKVTSLQGDFDASAPSTPSLIQRNDGKEETSASQEKDFDDAIESLIDNLNINYILGSKNSSSRDQKQMRTRERKENNVTILNKSYPKTSNMEEKLNSLIEHKNLNINEEDQSHAINSNDKENDKLANSGEDVIDEADNFNDENNDQSSNIDKTVEIDAINQSADKIENHSKDDSKNEYNKDVVHEVHKDYDSKDYKSDIGGKTDEADEDFESLSIPGEVSEQEHTSKSSERLLDMLDYEDLYKLLMKDS